MTKATKLSRRALTFLLVFMLSFSLIIPSVSADYDVDENINIEDTIDKNEVVALNPVSMYSASNDGISVSVTAPYDALPENAELVVSRLDETDSEYGEAVQFVQITDEQIAVLDISFLCNGVEVEPTAPVSVDINVDGIVPDNAKDITISHLEETGNGIVPETVAEMTNGETTATFDVDSFSKFTVQWDTDAEDGSIEVHMYLVNSIGIQEDFDSVNYELSEESTVIISNLVNHLTAHIPSNIYAFSYAEVYYESPNQRGAYDAHTIGSASESVQSINKSTDSEGNTVYTIVTDEGEYVRTTTTAYDDSTNADNNKVYHSETEGDFIFIYLYYTTPTVDISINTSEGVGTGIVNLEATTADFPETPDGATNDTWTYDWTVNNSQMGTFSDNTEETDNANVGYKIFTWNDSYAVSGDQAVVTVTVTHSYDLNGETVSVSAEDSFTLTFRVSGVIINVENLLTEAYINGTEVSPNSVTFYADDEPDVPSDQGPDGSDVPGDQGPDSSGDTPSDQGPSGSGPDSGEGGGPGDQGGEGGGPGEQGGQGPDSGNEPGGDNPGGEGGPGDEGGTTGNIYVESYVSIINNVTGETVFSGIIDKDTYDENNGLYTFYLGAGSYTIGVTSLMYNDFAQGTVYRRSASGTFEVLYDETAYVNNNEGSYSGVTVDGNEITLTLPTTATTTNDASGSNGHDDSYWNQNEYWYEHIDVKIAIAQMENADVEFSVLDNVLVYDEWGNLIYTGSDMIYNEQTEDFNCLFTICGVDDVHSLLVSSNDTVVVIYEITENGETKTYTATLQGGTVSSGATLYPEDEFYPYDDDNCAQIYMQFYDDFEFESEYTKGTTEYTNALIDAFVEFIDNLSQEEIAEKSNKLVTVTNANGDLEVIGISLEGMTYFQVADYLCDTRLASTQAGLDFVIDLAYDFDSVQFAISKEFNNFLLPDGTDDPNGYQFTFDMYESDSLWRLEDDTEVFGSGYTNEWVLDESTGTWNSIAIMDPIHYDLGTNQTDYYYVVIENTAENLGFNYSSNPDAYGIHVKLNRDGFTIEVAYVDYVELQYVDGTYQAVSSNSGSLHILDEEELGDLYDDTIPTYGGGLSFVNTYEPLNVTVEKAWNDDNNRDGVRPNDIDIILYGSDNSNYSATLTATGNWTYTFENLPVYDENGDEITYAVYELDIDGYDFVANAVTGNAVDGFVITLENTHTPETTSIFGTKTWDDNNNQDGFRPESITVILYADNTEIDRVTVTEDDNWSYSFSNLYVYRDNGTKIVYSVAEVPVYEYDTTINGTDITNSHTPYVIDIPVEKIWDDDNDRDSIRPESVTVTLTGSDDSSRTAVITEENDWTYTFEDLPVNYNNGTKIEYTLTEADVDGYSATITPIYNGYGFIITNAHQPSVRDIPVEKVWNDNDDEYGYRPESIEFTLTGSDGSSETVTISEENGWYYIFKDLPVFDNGEEIIYTVTETAINDYYTDITGDMTDGFVVTNNVVAPKLDKELVEDDYERKEADGSTMHNGEDTDGNGWGTWDDADNGQEITFHLTLTDIKSAINLTIHDYLEDGLNFELDTIEAVLYDNEEETILEEDVDYTIITGECTDPDCIMDDCTFEISFNDDVFVDISPEAYIIVSYKAFTETHADDYEDFVDPLMNEAYILYGAADFVHRSEPTSTETDLFGFDVYKYTNKDNELVALEGAEFILVKDDTYAQFDIEIGEDENTYYLLSGWTEDIEEAGIITSGNDGLIRVEGLDDDTYTLVETTAPVGYYELEKPVEFTIHEDGIVTGDTVLANDEIAVVGVENEEILTSVSGTKTWIDNDDENGARPDEITVRLYANGEEIDSIIVTEKDNWTYTFDDLVAYSNGIEIEYTITEDEVTDYETKYDGYDITNTYIEEEEPVIETLSFEVLKVWEDEDNADNIRPDDITIVLMANGDETKYEIVLDESNDWADTFEDLDVYDEDGIAIEYRIQELDVEGYTSKITGDTENGFVITNSHEVSVTAEPIPTDEPTVSSEPNNGTTTTETITTVPTVTTETVESSTTTPAKTGEIIGFSCLGVALLTGAGIVITATVRKRKEDN